MLSALKAALPFKYMLMTDTCTLLKVYIQCEVTHLAVLYSDSPAFTTVLLIITNAMPHTHHRQTTASCHCYCITTGSTSSSSSSFGLSCKKSGQLSLLASCCFSSLCSCCSCCCDAAVSLSSEDNRASVALLLSRAAPVSIVARQQCSKIFHMLLLQLCLLLFITHKMSVSVCVCCWASMAHGLVYNGA
jgi:hypothetical protein